MELPAGVGEEPREVAHALEVSHPYRVPLVGHQPVVALETEDVDVRSRLLAWPVLAPHKWVFDPLEERPGRLELQVCLVLAAAGTEGFGESEARRCGLVGRADLVPEPRSLRKEPFPSCRVALGEPHSCFGERGARDQSVALETSRPELQLVGGRAGSVDLSRRDLDLDLRLEQRRALEMGVSVVAPSRARARAARVHLG